MMEVLIVFDITSYSAIGLKHELMSIEQVIAK